MRAGHRRLHARCRLGLGLLLGSARPLRLAILGLLGGLQRSVLCDPRDLHRVLARHGVTLSARDRGHLLGLLPGRTLAGLLQGLERRILHLGGDLLCLLGRHGVGLRLRGGAAVGLRLRLLRVLGLGLLAVLCVLLVGCHQASISLLCGFWAACGCSGPA